MPDSSLMGLLRLFHASPDRTQREMAHELAMSVDTPNHLLKTLLGKGFLRVQNLDEGSDAHACAYLLSPEGVTA